MNNKSNSGNNKKPGNDWILIMDYYDPVMIPIYKWDFSLLTYHSDYMVIVILMALPQALAQVRKDGSL